MDPLPHSPPFPSDPVIRELIDRTAASIVTNGAGFEQYIATQHVSNPQFGFIRGGTYSDYFRFRLRMEQQSAPSRSNASAAASHASVPIATGHIDIDALQKQIDALKAQVAESENNVKQQQLVLNQTNEEQIDAQYVLSQREKITKLFTDCKLDVSKVDEILAMNSIHGGTISKLKHWILDFCNTEREKEIVFTYLLYRVKSSPITSQIRLLVLFMSDSLADYCHKRNSYLMATIGRYAPKFFAYASENTAESERIAKLHRHWERMQWFDTKAMTQIKNPQTVLTTERNIELGERTTMIAKIHNQNGSTLAGYEKQHAEFANHCHAQIITLQTAIDTEKRRKFLAEAADKKPEVPYYNLPAGICLPMVKAEDFNYKPIKVDDIRLPAMSASTERLNGQITRFYMTMPESNLDDLGWEKNSLNAFIEAKNMAKDQMEAVLKAKGKTLEDVFTNRYKSPSPEPESVKPRRTRFDEKPQPQKQSVANSNPFHYVYDDSGNDSKRQGSPVFEPPSRHESGVSATSKFSAPISFSFGGRQ